jgi:hypothetical protein
MPHICHARSGILRGRFGDGILFGQWHVLAALPTDRRRPGRRLSTKTMHPSRSTVTAPVWARDHFQITAVGIGKIDPASAVVMIDLAGTTTPRVGPVLETLLMDAAQDSIENQFRKSGRHSAVAGPVHRRPRNRGTLRCRVRPPRGDRTGMAPAALTSRPKNGRTLPGPTNRRWCG